MTDKNDGGMAFPCAEHIGMSLRDYFAAQCMDTIIHLSQTGDGEWDSSTVAYGAYAVADAMIEARKK